jgi:hypothetical protein
VNTSTQASCSPYFGFNVYEIEVSVKITEVKDLPLKSPSLTKKAGFLTPGVFLPIFDCALLAAG